MGAGPVSMLTCEIIVQARTCNYKLCPEIITRDGITYCIGGLVEYMHGSSFRAKGQLDPLITVVNSMIVVWEMCHAALEDDSATPMGGTTDDASFPGTSMPS